MAIIIVGLIIAAVWGLFIKPWLKNLGEGAAEIKEISKHDPSVKKFFFGIGIVSTLLFSFVLLFQYLQDTDYYKNELSYALIGFAVAFILILFAVKSKKNSQ